MGSCLLGEAFAYSEAARSQEFRAQPRCSFAFVLLSSGSVVERESSPSRSCFHSYLSKISSTTFPKVSNRVPVSGRDWAVWWGRKMQSFTYTFCAPTFIYDFIRLLCLCGVYSFTIHRAYLLCHRWEQWGKWHFLCMNRCFA